MKNSLLSALGLLAAMGMAETAAAQTQVFVHFPLKRNNTDSVAVRRPATGMTVTPLTLKRFVLSNGSAGATTAAFAPYSSVGMAFSTTANGSMGSSNTPGGPRRAFYVQFAITNSGTTDLRADSLIFTASTANSANGRAALSYSTTGFATDSMDFAGGGKGPAGALPSTGNGTFGAATSSQPAAAPIVLPSYSATAADAASTFRTAFASGNAGVTVPAGRTLTIRMYFRVGSDTEGRYFIMRNVILKGRQAVMSSAANARIIKDGLTLSPNPATSQVVVNHPTAKNGGVVSVYTTTGQKVATLATQTGAENTTLNLDKLAAGLYLVEYADGEQRATSRIVKQ